MVLRNATTAMALNAAPEALELVDPVVLMPVVVVGVVGVVLPPFVYVSGT